MSKFSLCLAAAAVFVVLAATFAAAAEEEATDAKPKSKLLPLRVPGQTRPRMVRSLAQACRAEIIKLCAPDGKINMRGSKCLESKRDQIDNPVCKSWMDAREACFADVEKAGNCQLSKAGLLEKKTAAAGKMMFTSKRQCLRKLPADKLSETCASSDFLRSVKFMGAAGRQFGARRGELSKPEGQA